jgi:hypothetical protein
MTPELRKSKFICILDMPSKLRIYCVIYIRVIYILINNSWPFILKIDVRVDLCFVHVDERFATDLGFVAYREVWYLDFGRQTFGDQTTSKKRNLLVNCSENRLVLTPPTLPIFLSITYVLRFFGCRYFTFSDVYIF